MKLPSVILSLIFVTFSVGLAEADKKNLEENRKCAKEIGGDEILIQHLRQGDFSNSDEDHQRFIFCIFRKHNVITADGKLNKDVALSRIPQHIREKGEAAVSACMDEKGATPQETAWKIAKCYYGKNPGHVSV